MGELFDRMKQFFTDDEWYFIQMGNKPVLQLSYTGHSGRWPCYAQVDEEQSLFFFYSICPVTVPDYRRNAMSEFLTRANYGMKVGNFEMDYSDGEVRFKTSVDVDKDELTRPILANLVYSNIWSMDKYLPGIFAVIYSEKSPEEVIQRIEGA